MGKAACELLEETKPYGEPLRLQSLILTMRPLLVNPAHFGPIPRAILSGSRRILPHFKQRVVTIKLSP